MTDLWVKTHIVQQGPLLVATAYVNQGLNNEIFRIAIDTRPIAKRLIQLHKRLHAESISGCVGCDTVGLWGLGKVVKKLKKAVKKVGRVKLIRKVVSTAKWVSPHYTAYKLTTSAKTRRLARQHSKTALRLSRKVLRSKVTAGVITAAAFAFPPVGTPALAAYASANAALAAVENGNKVRAKIKSLVRGSKYISRFKKSIVGKSKRSVKRVLKTKPKLRVALKSSIAKKIKLRAIYKNKPVIRRIRKTQTRRIKAVKVLKRVSNTIRYSNSPTKRIQAQKAAAVLAIVARNRAQLRAIKQRASTQRPKGIHGVLITKVGPVRGRFVKRPVINTNPDLLMLSERNEPGSYTRIGGCIGCGIFAL